MTSIYLIGLTADVCQPLLRTMCGNKACVQGVRQGLDGLKVHLLWDCGELRQLVECKRQECVGAARHTAYAVPMGKGVCIAW